MVMPVEFQVPIAVAAGVLVLAMLAEKLHRRRCRAVALLASGPGGRPRRWVQAVPGVKAVSLAAMAWALATLFFSAGGVYLDRDKPENRRRHHRHVVFAVDLSPSMLLCDAGPGGELTRSERMGEVVDALLKRLDSDLIYTVVGFYTTTWPIIVDAEDPGLVRNVFDGLPVWYVMEPGKTDLGSGVRSSLEHLKDYPEHSTTLFICTDGDTIPMGSISKPPASVGDVYVLGVGDPRQGTFIDGHMSRQDAAVLSTLAGRLGGQYLDVNEKHVPTLGLGRLAMGAGAAKSQLGLVDVAILVFAVAALVHALLPVALEYFGSGWRAVQPKARSGSRFHRAGHVENVPHGERTSAL
jgi:Ca-activated chloride channel family protein